MEGSRRLFLKRAATGVGVAWAAPAITTIDVSHAQGASAPPLAGGRAYGVEAFGVTITVPPKGDTGDQPGSFGPTCEPPFTTRVPPTGNPMLARVQVLTGGTACGSTFFTPTDMQSKADVLKFKSELPTGVPKIEADKISATAIAPLDCATPPSGSVAITKLKIAGKDIIVTGLPNQEILHPKTGTKTARIVINEQITECRNVAGVDQEYFIVNAIHVYMPPTGPTTHELIVGHTEASSGCPC